MFSFKRFFALSCAAALLLTAAGCGGKGSSDPSETESAASGETNAANETRPGFELKDADETALSVQLERLGVEYALIDPVPPDEAVVALFRQELEKGKAGGYTPVLLVDNGFLSDHLKMMLDEGYSVKDELEKPLPNAESFLSERLDGFEDLLRADTGGADELMLAPSYVFSGTAGASFFGEQMDVLLVKLPTDKPWEAALYLPFGGWNYCPAPLEMASVLKLWYESYGAVPAMISHDTLDMCLASPIPSDRAESAALQQIAFDEDLLMTGVSVSGLAKLLEASDIWSFWWD